MVESAEKGVSRVCPIFNHRMRHKEVPLVFDGQQGSSAVLRDGGAAYHPDQRRRDSRRRQCSSIVPRKTGSRQGLGGWIVQ